MSDSQKTPPRVFLAGVIQGNRATGITGQDYRRRITELVAAHAPAAELYDPFAHHPDSIGYDDERGRRVFVEHVRLAAASDLVIVFLPEASMGSAVEMWAAAEAGVPVVAISPLIENWTIRFLSDLVLPDLAAFAAWLAGGGLDRLAGRRKTGQHAGPR